MNNDISRIGGNPIDAYSIGRQINQNRKNKYKRFALAALGSVPWVGGIDGNSCRN